MLAQTRLYQGFTAIARGPRQGRHHRVSSTAWWTARLRLRRTRGVALFKGDNTRAATLLGIANGVRVRAAHPVWPDMRPVIDDLIAGAKAAVGDEEFDIAWRAGHSLTRVAAKTFALRAGVSAPASR